MINIADHIGNATEFPILGHWDFFNHAGVSPLPRCAAAAIETYAHQASNQAYLNTGWYRQIEGLRESAAKMINAHRDEIALTRNTSEGIATVAAAIDWQKGDRIVTTNIEYPANMYPWMDVARRFGVELITVPERDQSDGSRAVDLEEILNAADHPRTRLLAISHVEYASGQRHDLHAIGAFCASRGIRLCVDAIQSMGVLPVDVCAMNIDYLSADGHKWLLGPEGAGVFYCRKELLAQTRPLILGWMNVINDQDYGTYDLTLKPDARRFEGGTHNVPGMLAFKASLEMLNEVGVGAVGSQLHELTTHLITGLRRKGYGIISPRDENSWSGIVSFVSGKHDHLEVFKMLRHEHQTEIAVREKRLRVSAHYYNTIHQMDRLIGNLPGH